MKTVVIPLSGADQLRPVNDEQLTTEIQTRAREVDGVSTRHIRGRLVEVHVHYREGASEEEVAKVAKSSLDQHVPEPVETVASKLAQAGELERLDLIERFIIRRFGDELWVE